MDTARILRLRTHSPSNQFMFRLFTEETSLWCSHILDLVPAISIARDERHFPDLAPSQKLGFLINENHKIHCLRNQGLLRSARRFGNETLEADQSTQSVVRMHGCGPARMPGIPGFQHR